MDHRVAEFAAALPWSWKQRGRTRKRILLAACGDLLPESIRNRGKMGFGVPLARWFRGEWLSVLRDVLLDSAVDRHGFLDRDGVARLIDAHVACRADHSYALWALFVLELWLLETGQG